MMDDRLTDDDLAHPTEEDIAGLKRDLGLSEVTVHQLLMCCPGCGTPDRSPADGLATAATTAGRFHPNSWSTVTQPSVNRGGLRSGGASGG